MKKNFIYTLLIMFCLTVPGTAESALYNGHEYVVIVNPCISWQDATIDMNRILGPDYHLATITSLGEQSFIASLLRTISGEFWLGGYQPEGENRPGKNWQWVTGESWEYTNWEAGEPNDFYGRGSEQHLALRKIGGAWKWNDEGNVFNITGYIAESYTQAPLPGALLLMCTGLTALAGLKKVLANRLFVKRPQP